MGWGEPRTLLKWEQVSELRPNTVFVGSSRVFNHFDPTEVDPLLADLEIESYNMGLPASQLSWTESQIIALLQRSQELGLRFVLCEVARFDTLSDNNKYAMRSRYWMSAEDVIRPTLAQLERRAVRGALLPAANNGTAYLMKLLNLEYVHTNYHRVYRTDVFRAQLDDWDPNRRGFFSPPLTKHGKVSRSRQQLLEHPDTLDAVVRAARRAPPTQAEPFLELETYNSLIATAESSGVRVIFMLTPRGKTARDALAIYAQLPDKHRLDLDLPDRFPELYSLENSYDKGHMNRAGVTLFSQRFAELFREYLARHPVNTDSVNRSR